MLAESQTVAFAPHLALAAGLAIVLTVLGLYGDGLRDLIDPRVRRARA